MQELTQAVEQVDGFEPFEKTIICPRCNRPLQLYLQPVHLSAAIHCPRCNRPLSGIIRRAIRDYRASVGALSSPGA